VSLTIRDSATRTLRTFEPLEPGKVGIYLCGATVQGAPHIGHMRSGIAFDVLNRWLQRSGYDVTMIRNVTDIDDKILAKSTEAGRPFWAWAYRFEREFSEAYAKLGVLPPTYEPRATGHVTQMFDLIAEIIARGHAYVGEPGNVYFDVASLPDYGSLTHQSLDNMLADSADAEPDKRGPHDFALWKAPKATDPADAQWDSPWGPGRPGWHLECSAMAGAYLGDEFDIHAGGIDLRFPHHENEQAQSHAAGRGFARYWMHNHWVTIGEEKMGKSLGNALTVPEVLKSTSAAVVRLALGTVHYGSPVAYTDKTLAEAAVNWQRLTGFVERLADGASPDILADDADLAAATLPEKFTAAMDDDLNVSAAMAVVHETVTATNAALAAGSGDASGALLQVRAMLDVLGLDPLSTQWRESGLGGASREREALGVLIERMLEQRSDARAAKDWAAADGIRDSLTAAGIVIEDGPSGARWHVSTEDRTK